MTSSFFICKRIFQDIYFSIEEVDGIGVLYTKTGEYSAVLKMENPVQKYSANIEAYYEFTHLFAALAQTLGEGYALHKQDVFVRKAFKEENGGNHEFLSESYFRYFNGRPFTDSVCYLTITQENKKSRLMSFDNKKWRDFLVKIRKVHDQLRDAGVKSRFLGKTEACEYVDRFFSMNFRDKVVVGLFFDRSLLDRFSWLNNAKRLELMILVTAKATVENQVEGLNTGADAYVTKPFEPNYLLALIKSQLKNREKVRSLLSRSTQTDEIEENVLSPQDNTFMTELYHLMENELSNPELDVARMTELLKISRTKFYYKVKGLTGENPSVFFKTYKLNRAAKLIKEGKYTISEIADMTGFSTLSHFSTSFKKQFGATPSEYSK